MSRTTRAAMLVAAGGIAGAAGFLFKSSSGPAPAPVATPIVATAPMPRDWGKASAICVDIDMAGADRVTYAWLAEGVSDEDNAINVPGADESEPDHMLIKQPATITLWIGEASTSITWGGPGDFDGDGDAGTDADIEAFFACLRGECCPTCTADIDHDGDVGTDADIQAMYAAVGGRRP